MAGTCSMCVCVGLGVEVKDFDIENGLAFRSTTESRNIAMAVELNRISFTKWGK